MDLAGDDAEGMMSVVRLTSHGDNMNFFGLGNSNNEQTGSNLYTKMSQKFFETKDVDQIAPSWRDVIYAGAVQAADDVLTGPQYNAEKSRISRPPWIPPVRRIGSSRGMIVFLSSPVFSVIPAYAGMTIGER